MEDNAKDELLRQAREQGACEQGREVVRGYKRDKMIETYLRTIDWSLECGFPSMELMRREFSDCEADGIYVDKTFDGELFAQKQVYVFHNCKGRIRVAMDYDNAVIPMLYFANGCEMEVICDQENTPAIKVPLYVVDDGSCAIQAADTLGCEFRRYAIVPVEP